MTTEDPVASSPALAVALAELLRQSLAAGTGPDELTAMLEALADVRDYDVVILARGEGEHLELVAWTGPDGFELPVSRLHQAHGIAGYAYRTGETAVTEDAADDPRWYDISDGTHRSGIAVPLRLPDRIWGVMVAEAREPGQFDDEDVASLVPVADELAWALETIRLKEEATERAAHEERLRRGLEATAAVITAGLEATELETALDRMVREIRDQLGWEAISVLLVEGDHTIRVAAHHGFEQDVAAQTYSTKRGILGHVAVTGQPYLTGDVTADRFYDEVVTSTRSELCVPIVFAGEVRGLINAESPEPHRFEHEDLDILTRIADQMSLVMHNLELLGSREETVQRLHELDRLKTRLLTIASHELRTPLTVVMGFAEVLETHAAALPPEQLQEYAEAIVRQSAELSHLVDQMLLASRIEQGQIAVRPKPIALAEVVDNALGALAGRIEVLEGIAQARVVADAQRLQQVLENLFENAAKYTDEDGRIQIDARPVGPDVVILLRDEGPGIPGEEHERVFEAFHQIGEHGVAGRRGVGLGLAVARDLMRLMDGELELASAEGYGATFLLRLPAAA
ncbi:MAG: GAF domain-containing protein [Nitriliruptorales bacterium]|nr:GAF domain-containing protein [Nitriliruptorales bacterium]